MLIGVVKVGGPVLANTETFNVLTVVSVVPLSNSQLYKRQRKFPLSTSLV